MKFDMDEISSLIRQEIGRYRSKLDVARVGRVLEVADGIARIYGLDNAMAGEMLEFDGGVMGEVFNLEEESVGAVIYGDYRKVKESSIVRSTGGVLTVPTGPALIGRVVDALCKPIDGKAPIDAAARRLVEYPAPGIAGRQPVDQPLSTGIKCIDSMIPIGRGQRELIIGDRKTGKTAIALDTIINQKDTGVVCVYAAIGQKESTVAEVVRTLSEHGAMAHTIVISACASESAAMQFVAPYTATAVAEYFMYELGKDTLCVYDDLTKHAIAYRELSLLLRRPPGREAYPGDIFYLHSRLLERSARVTDDLGGGSLTALPIHTHQHHLDYRRADIPGSPTVPVGCPAGGRCGHQRQSCRRKGPARGHEKGRPQAAARPGGVSRAAGFRKARYRARCRRPQTTRSGLSNGGSAQAKAVCPVDCRRAGCLRI